MYVLLMLWVVGVLLHVTWSIWGRKSAYDKVGKSVYRKWLWIKTTAGKLRRERNGWDRGGERGGDEGVFELQTLGVNGRAVEVYQIRTK